MTEYKNNGLDMSIFTNKDTLIDIDKSSVNNFKAKNEFVNDNISDIIVGSKITPFMRYIITSQASVDFKKALIESDKQIGKYTVKTTKNEADKNYLYGVWSKQIEVNAKYAVAIDSFKSSHSDWFETTYAIANIAPYIDYFISSSDHNKVIKNISSSSIEDVFNVYKCINDAKKNIDRNSLPKTEKTTVKNEYKDQWKAISDSMKAEYSYKTFEQIEKEVIAAGYSTVVDHYKVKPIRMKNPEFHENIFMEYMIAFMSNI